MNPRLANISTAAQRAGLLCRLCSESISLVYPTLVIVSGDAASRGAWIRAFGSHYLAIMISCRS